MRWLACRTPSGARIPEHLPQRGTCLELGERLTSRSRRCATRSWSARVKLPTIEDAVKAGGFLAGRPEDIIEALKAVEKRYPGLDRVICATPLGTPLNVQLADLDRFAKEVIPAFRNTRLAAAAQ